METSKKYGTEPNPNRQANKYTGSRRLILSNPYCQTIKEFMQAIIVSGNGYEDCDELWEMAKQAADSLIKNTGEKL